MGILFDFGIEYEFILEKSGNNDLRNHENFRNEFEWC